MIKLDGSQPKVSNKVLGEKETRRRLLKLARKRGCYEDMKILFEKYDKLMRNCTNEQERKDISACACVETYNLLGRGGELYVNGQLVCKDN